MLRFSFIWLEIKENRFRHHIISIGAKNSNCSVTYLHVQKSSSYLLHRGRTTLIIPRFSGRSKSTYAQSVTNTWSQCTYIGLCGWYKKCIFILTYALNIDIKRSNIVNINLIFNKYSKSKPLAPLNQDIGLVYDTFIYDEDPHFHCIEPTQHNWVSNSNYIKGFKAQIVMICKATFPLPRSHPVHLQKTITIHPGNQIPCILWNYPICALWAYLLGFVNRMTRIGIDKPP